MPVVLILSDSIDIHADVVETELKRRGVEVARFNTDLFLRDKVELCFSEKGMAASYVQIKGVRYAFDDITSVWYRRPGALESLISDPHQKRFAEGEAAELFRQLYAGLGGPLWVSSYGALEAARRKYPQLMLAKKIGFVVPRTIMTNSPEEARRFISECRGRVVYKTLYAPVIKLRDTELFGVPTTILTEKMISQIDLIHSTGGIFQEYVEKSYEIRVTIIGKDVFAARIDSQSDAISKVDWRDGVALGKVGVSTYQPPLEIKEQCRQILDSYGLSFGAIDLIRAPGGKYVFLEINCNGQWLWVEDFTGQPLLESMVRLLTKRIRR